MFYLSEKEYSSRMEKVQEKNASRDRKKRLWQERFKYFPKFKLPSTSKIFLFVGFLIFIEIIIFCQYLAVTTNDTTPLVAMIGAIGGLISMFYTYSKKSTIENSRNGIIFETAMLEQQNINISDVTLEEALG